MEGVVSSSRGRRSSSSNSHSNRGHFKPVVSRSNSKRLELGMGRL